MKRYGLLAMISLGIWRVDAQSLVIPSQLPAVKQALAYVQRTEPQTIAEQIAICQIESPPFKEAKRAEFLKQNFVALGLKNVRIDSVGNVIGERTGDPAQPAVVIAGHLDTVFPEGTNVTVRREGTLLSGPGIEDNCRGLAVIRSVARALDDAKILTGGTIYFVGTVGEEGPGNLRGVRYLMERELKGKVGYFISVDADALNAVKDAVGSYRYKVTFTGPGGHSFGAFGMPNPMHALGRAIARIADFQVPMAPKVTFSVGILEGGTTVNSIPASASFQIDMRAESLIELDKLDARFRTAVNQALSEEQARWPQSDVKLRVAFDKWGNRPAGAQPADARIVRATEATAKSLGFAPTFSASSTDANLPISLGIPAITIGGGGKATGGHSLDEKWDSTDSHLGTQWALLLVLTLAGVRG